jgi:hypothetical protein
MAEFPYVECFPEGWKKVRREREGGSAVQQAEFHMSKAVTSSNIQGEQGGVACVQES